jgi:prepilin signal peptidase PulO-like enzyme (type II secretory pathway)
MGAALRVGYSLTLVPAWIFTSLLIVAAFTDIDHWIIPDRVSLGGLVAGLALAAIPAVASARLNPLTPSNPDSLVLLFMETCLRWLPRAFWPLANSVIGAAAGGLGLWSVGVVGSLVFRKEAMGMGDVKLFAMFGAFCGLGGLLPILMIASVIGMGVGLWGFVASKRAASRPGVSPDPAIAPACLGAEAQAVLLASHGLDGEERAVVAEALAHPGPFGGARHHLPFGPSLAIAAYVVYLWGGDLTRLVFYWLDPARGVGW